MRIARRVGREVKLGEGAGAGKDENQLGSGEQRQRQPPAVCGCGRKLRMAPSVLAQGPVVCGLCGQDFSIETSVERRPAGELAAHPPGIAANVPADDSFLTRRSAELAQERHDDAQLESSRLLHPSRHGELSPLQREGLAETQRLVETAEGAALLADVHAWNAVCQQFGDVPLVGTTAEEVGAANAAARAVRKLDGSLTGPGIDLPAGQVLTGELVMMAEAPPGSDSDPDLPAPGMIGTVERVDLRAREIEVDFPVAGRYRFDVDGAAAATAHLRLRRARRSGWRAAGRPP